MWRDNLVKWMCVLEGKVRVGAGYGDDLRIGGWGDKSDANRLFAARRGEKEHHRLGWDRSSYPTLPIGTRQSGLACSCHTIPVLWYSVPRRPVASCWPHSFPFFGLILGVEQAGGALV